MGESAAAATDGVGAHPGCVPLECVDRCAGRTPRCRCGNGRRPASPGTGGACRRRRGAECRTGRRGCAGIACEASLRAGVGACRGAAPCRGGGVGPGRLEHGAGGEGLACVGRRGQRRRTGARSSGRRHRSRGGCAGQQRRRSPAVVVVVVPQLYDEPARLGRRGRAGRRLERRRRPGPRGWLDQCAAVQGRRCWWCVAGGPGPVGVGDCVCFTCDNHSHAAASLPSHRSSS